MDDHDLPPGGACCDSAAACVFSKALLARAAVCERAARRSLGERELIECTSPVARTNCGTLAALLHERARFALRLPAAGHPVFHAQALRLQCGGLLGLQQALAVAQADVHQMVGTAHERYGSLTEVPWDTIVDVIKAWQSSRQRRITRP